MRKDALQHSRLFCSASLMRAWPCRQVGVAERFDASQNQEVTQFLDAIAQTPCIQYVHQLLVAKVCQDAHFNMTGCYTIHAFDLMVLLLTPALQHPGP